jgi:dienelactone hydrolase
MDTLRNEICSFIGVGEDHPEITPVVHDAFQGEGFSRKVVSYKSDGELIQAFLFEPRPEHQRGIAAVVLHQHNSQWHIGKNEIAGLAGDPLQAFGPALAREGIAVLTFDAVGFESRRGATFNDGMDRGLAPQLNPNSGSTPGDWLQYYNHAMHRLARGELLMRKALVDVANATSALRALTGISNTGVVGHSYGGNVALFSAALDTRVSFAVSSGAVCSYKYKLAHGTGLEMALVIPGFATRFDFEHLLQCVAPRSLLVVSSDDDPFSADADELVASARHAFQHYNAADRLRHLRTPGPHVLDQRRFDAIVEWVSHQSGLHVRR